MNAVETQQSGISFSMKKHVLNGVLLIVVSAILMMLSVGFASATAYADAADAGASSASAATNQVARAEQQSGDVSSSRVSVTTGSALSAGGDSGDTLAAGSVAASEGAAEAATKSAGSTSIPAGEAAKKTTGIMKQSMRATAQYGYYYASRTALQAHSLCIYYPVNVSNSHGRLTYSNCSTNATAKKLNVNVRTGQITLPKGYSKSLVTVKIRVRAAGDSRYAAASRVVSMKIRLASKQRGAAQAAINEWWHGVRNGTMNAGGQKYWSAWYEKRQAWCSEFAGWCLIDSGYEPGVNMPNRPTTAPQYVSFYKKHPEMGKIKKVSAKTKFKPGDILIRCNKKGKPIHTGVAVKYSNGQLTTIEGNGHDTVVKRTYAAKTLKKRWGYCIRLAS